MDKLTAERLRHLLDYDPVSGVFTWKNPPHARFKVGQVTGTVNTFGYVVIVVDGKARKAHRLAWLYMTGEFPPNQMDHINRIKTDNRWENLRPATRQQNSMNCTRNNNTSGKKGVSWDKQNGKWQARIRVNGKLHHLGFYHDIEDAAVAYKNIARILHGDFNHFGEETN